MTKKLQDPIILKKTFEKEIENDFCLFKYFIFIFIFDAIYNINIGMVPIKNDMIIYK